MRLRWAPILLRYGCCARLGGRGQLRIYARLDLCSKGAPNSANSAAVVRPIPLNEAPDPDLERRARPVAHVPRQRIDVRPGVRHVAELHRNEVLLSLAPQAFL